ncbi:hypothetical protein WJR50_07255 [Catalinimonas sp. 4WD22]|uniref:hypothetical protein n=1 Tax=Catalinimonas locisalis TaxID=3133978 RepID=UPI00310150CD
MPIQFRKSLAGRPLIVILEHSGQERPFTLGTLISRRNKFSKPTSQLSIGPDFVQIAGVMLLDTSKKHDEYLLSSQIPAPEHKVEKSNIAHAEVLKNAGACPLQYQASTDIEHKRQQQVTDAHCQSS